MIAIAWCVIECHNHRWRTLRKKQLRVEVNYRGLLTHSSLGGGWNSMNIVISNPASTAACVPTVMRFPWCKLNSFSFNAVACCRSVLCSWSLSAASMMLWCMIISLVTTEQSSNTEDTATSSFYQDYYGARRECWDGERSAGLRYLLLGSLLCTGSICQNRYNWLKEKDASSKHTFVSENVTPSILTERIVIFVSRDDVAYELWQWKWKTSWLY